MTFKIRVALLLAILLSLAAAVPGLAGGWAVITLDELPSNVVAGTPVTMSFTVRQHGITLLDGLDPTVTAILPKAEHFVVHAEPDGKSGHYTATLTFPGEGTWEWSIHAFTMDQPMPALHVAAVMTDSASQPISKIESRSAFPDPIWILSGLGFGAALVSMILAFQRKSRIAGTFAGLCLVLSIGTFMLAGNLPNVAAQSHQGGELSAEAALSQVEFGRQLFLAKGCITCHYNSRAAQDDYLTIQIGAPDLSNYSSHPEVLFIRLKDPAAAKSDTKMPNLELKETEIEALIAFINAK